MTRETPSPTDEQRTAPATEAAADRPTVTDPASLHDRPDVQHVEDAFVHDSEDHCEAGSNGRAIVGVTNEDGAVLTLYHPGPDAYFLPSEPVDVGEDYLAVAAQAVENATGLQVRVTDPVRVRTATHHLEDAAGPFDTSTHVLFRATPLAAPADRTTDDSNAPGDGVVLRWLSDLPSEAATADRPPGDDVHAILEREPNR